MIDKAASGLGCGLLTPHSVFVVGSQTAALKARNNRDRQRKTAKSMTVSHKTVIDSSQSSKVAPLAPLLAPTATEKIARFVKDTRVRGIIASALKQRSMTGEGLISLKLRHHDIIKQYQAFQPGKDEDDEECM